MCLYDFCIISALISLDSFRHDVPAYLLYISLFSPFFFPSVDEVSLCTLDWPGAHYVVEAGLELIEIDSASASSVLKFKVCVAIPSYRVLF